VHNWPRISILATDKGDVSMFPKKKLQGDRERDKLPIIYLELPLLPYAQEHKKCKDLQHEQSSSQVVE
jgi:hypothetical protein